jgi:hypothetical protein
MGRQSDASACAVNARVVIATQRATDDVYASMVVVLGIGKLTPRICHEAISP